MSEPFLGEIRIFGGTYAPQGWATCDGQLLPINQNQALFAILGTTYGGDGVTNFALPNLKGRAPVMTGNGVTLGQKAGEEVHVLTVNEMPAHTHMTSAGLDHPSNTAAGSAWGGNSSTDSYAPQANVQMNANALATSGGSQAHDNRQPHLVLNFCIALQGIFPTRN